MAKQKFIKFNNGEGPPNWYVGVSVILGIIVALNNGIVAGVITGLFWPFIVLYAIGSAIFS
jgi:hypothetical protein